MRVVFFSDAHGNYYAIEALMKKLENMPSDLVIFGGDVFGYYYAAEEILATLRAHNVHCLLGNHDRYFLDLLSNTVSEEYLVGKYGNSYRNIKSRISKENVDFLRSLSPSYALTVDGIRLFFAHGSIKDPLNGRVYPDSSLSEFAESDAIDYVFLGHTHHRMIRKVNNVTIINPGSIGQQRDGLGCTFVVFDTHTKEIAFHEVEYDVASLVRDVNVNDTGDMRDRLVECLYRSRK